MIRFILLLLLVKTDLAPPLRFELSLAVLETVVLPLNTKGINLERVARIELANSRWQRDRLPLHHTRINTWLPGVGSNHRHSD